MLLTEGAAMAKYVREKRDFYLEKYSWDSVADRIAQVLRKDGCL